MAAPKRILVCPLDWGLGHATRCIPVIHSLLERDVEIFIASSGDALELLKQEFPRSTFFELPSYRPAYQSTGFLSLALLKQLPKFKKVIHDEHLALEDIVRKNSIDLVISDNRYGCWSTKARSVFITHQVSLLMPKGFGWTSSSVNYFLHRYLRKFSEIWIPDQDGELTFPFASKKIANQKYIGWLSRFKKDTSIKNEYDIIALVSGPEPQRSEFQKVLTDQLISSGKVCLLVTGQPGKTSRTRIGNLEIVNHLQAEELGKAIQASGIIICRSGYSSVMDLIALQRGAIFVPTPQQPEQLFLAEFLDKKGLALAMNQKDFDLGFALRKVNEYKGFSHYKIDKNYLDTAIDDILK